MALSRYVRDDYGTQMELATLICANTRKRAIEIAGERSLPRSAEQNELRYNSTGVNLQWAYIGDRKSLFGRPQGSLVIFDDSARKLGDWNWIIDYVARNDFRCEWVGRWLPAIISRSVRTERFTQELSKLNVCAVCKKMFQTVVLYEGPGLVHFIHGQGKECRVAVDMSNLRGALETLTKAVTQPAFDKVAAMLPELIREQQRVPAEMRREWLGSGFYEEPPEPPDSDRFSVERMKWEALQERDRITAQRMKWEALQERDRITARLQEEEGRWSKETVGRALSPPMVIDPPKPVLPAVVSRTTVRKVKFGEFDD